MRAGASPLFIGLCAPSGPDGKRARSPARSGCSPVGVRTTTYQRSPVTPTVALMFKPMAGLTTYVSYVEALERGGTAGETTANAGEVMPPLKSKQIEAGVKVEQANWSATAAVFRN